MTEVVLNNVPVRFPFEPYDVQQNYMRKVIECLQDGKNGVLESPTGTGKTLCLLCSSLAWLEMRKAEHGAKSLSSNMSEDTNQSFLNSLSSQLKSAVGGMWRQELGCPKIIYSSRTHSQLSQAVNELKKTTYRHLKVAIIGSREQLCIHPEVSKETNHNTKVQLCQVQTQRRSCFFFNQVETMKVDTEVKNSILDIEDLAKLGKKKRFCPYYMARELKQDADIIFLPYNYLLDPKSRSAHNISLEGNVVIFDEAHNVEKMCEDAASLQLKSTDLALCINEVTHVMKKLQEMKESYPGEDGLLPVDFTAEDLYILKTIFLELEKAVDEIVLPADGSGLIYPGNFIFDLLKKADITSNKKAVIMDLLEKLTQYLTMNSSSPFQRKGAGLQKFSTLIQTVFSKEDTSISHMELINQCYKVHITVEEKRKPTNKDGWNSSKPSGIGATAGKVISYWCLNPGFGMKALSELGLHSIILTSGTLSPLDSFTSELQISFPVQLENPHIIKPCQVWVGTLTTGPDGHILNSSYQNRDNVQYLNSLGLTILNFMRIVPGGLLVFFSSYTTLRKSQEEWQNSGLWTKLNNFKQIFVEPQTKEAFAAAMDGFYEKVRDPALKGACFLAVCRGKVSEGLDFANQNGRAVIITGLPYPPFFDPRVKLKQKYLDEVWAKYKRGLTGSHWYKLEASRAVNQAIGRVIRHKDDFGAIILCDKRFTEFNFQQELSSWVRPHLKTHKNFGIMLRELGQFFRINKSMFPEPVLSATPSSSAGRATVKIEYDDEHSTSSIAVRAKAFESTHKRLVMNGSKTNINTSEECVLDANSVYGGKNSDVNSETVKSVVPKPFFKALDEGTSVLDFNCRPSSSNISSAFKEVNSDLVPKRKRIKIIANSEYRANNLIGVEAAADGVEAAAESAVGKLDDHSSSSREDVPRSSGVVDAHQLKQMKISKYLKVVRSVISPDEYKTFSEAIKKYKQSKDIDAMIAVLLSVFGSDRNRHHLLLKFVTFLRPHDRQQLETVYKDMVSS